MKRFFKDRNPLGLVLNSIVACLVMLYALGEPGLLVGVLGAVVGLGLGWLRNSLSSRASKERVHDPWIYEPDWVGSDNLPDPDPPKVAGEHAPKAQQPEHQQSDVEDDPMDWRKAA